MKRRASVPEPFYAQVLDNLEVAVVALDRDGRVTLFNPSAQACFGLSERQCLGKEFEVLFAGQERLLYLIRCALHSGRSISDHENIAIVRSAPPPVPVSVTVSAIYTRNGEREGAVLIVRDLTRIRELEEAVRRSDRLAILGTLAAGLAHEIKNPLGGIKGAAQLLDREVAAQSPLKEYTEVMIRETERVNAIIEELMDLARPRPPQFSPVHLAKILADVVLFQKEAHRAKEIVFSLHVDPSIPPLLGDENLLTRLFLNLVKNAAEAIEHKGGVEISMKISSDYHLTNPGTRPSPLVVVEIRDSGKGICAADLDKIFTPFYTTKDRGSGLGLAICQKIVTEHGGFLKIDSSPQQGTSVVVHLPFLR